MLRNTLNFLACLSLLVSPLPAQEPLPTTVDTLAVPITPVSAVNSDLLNPTSAAEWISLDAESGVNGKLGALDEAGVWVAKPGVAVSLSINGKLVSQSVTDVSGQFRLANVRPGTYAFVASSNYSFSTFGVHVYAKGTDFPTLMEVTTTNIPVSQARAIVKDHWVPNISSQDYYRVLASDPLGASRTVSGYKIRLIDGDLAGRVSRPGWGFGEQDLSGNVAHVIRAGSVIATAAVQADGRYVVKDLAPGVYDLIVAGDDGVAAVGFEAVGPEPLASKRTSKVHLVSQDTAADSINLELVLPSDVFIIIDHQDFRWCIAH